MANTTCFCGATFATLDIFRTHVLSKGHRIKCTCGALFGGQQSLLDH